jgi:hypothetical protein
MPIRGTSMQPVEQILPDGMNPLSLMQDECNETNEAEGDCKEKKNSKRLHSFTLSPSDESILPSN